MTPRELALALLAALSAADGRRRARKRDQTPDGLGLAMKRALLERLAEADPPAEALEAWLQPHAANPMARTILEEWRLAQALPAFAGWLGNGAPSDDADAQRHASCRGPGFKE